LWSPIDWADPEEPTINWGLEKSRRSERFVGRTDLEKKPQSASRRVFSWAGTSRTRGATYFSGLNAPSCFRILLLKENGMILKNNTFFLGVFLGRFWALIYFSALSNVIFLMNIDIWNQFLESKLFCKFF
jgi:hypothetical protein